ncbi:hypothetical protein ArsFIN_12440 [Arsenophonus nasoniae]|uniref:Uncharacterized protein n=1 Tax=Arsenophonus nasoniae TaxID=638 RepID=A0A4P7KRL7_9GAMM|nr:hypothetical protein ArsFIN_12440 [Arsenophonus nasoniae]
MTNNRSVLILSLPIIEIGFIYDNKILSAKDNELFAKINFSVK